MIPITDFVLDALESRLLGSGDFHTGFKPLDTALTLQFRLHYHLFGKGISVVVGQVLLDECGKLENEVRALHQKSVDNDARSLIRKIAYNVRGILSYHMDELEQASQFLAKGAQIKIAYEDFERCLNLENAYYRGLTRDDRSSYGKDIFEILGKIPRESHAITWHYLQLMCEALTSEQLKALPGGSPLTCLAKMFTSSYDEDNLITIATAFLKDAKFPQSADVNDESLVQFHLFLHHFFRKQKCPSVNWNPFIVSSMEKTFQSVEVSKTAMLYFSRQKDDFSGRREALLNFVKYVNHSERNYIINGEKYDDVVSLIDSYAFVLGAFKNKSSNLDNLFDIEDTIRKLLRLLESFYLSNGFSLMNENDSLNWLENSSKLILPLNVSKILSSAWRILYEHRIGSLQHLLSNQSTSYLSNAMCVESNDERLCDLQFQYAFLLAEKRLILPASKILKSVILEANPECYKAWHLLALCESIREDKESSFKIVCSVIEAMKESSVEKKLSKTDRWQYVQLKLTQLSLIEEIFGTLDAIEMLPEVFELYASLFPEGTTEYDSIGEEINQSKDYLLQMIWIFAANMYLRLSDKSKDCRNAIKEAGKVTDSYKNLNCNIASGYMHLAENKLEAALKEFEQVLFYDQYNVQAMLGFAEIVFPNDISESEALLQEHYDLIPQPKSRPMTKVFVNGLDESAACARLKFLLEYSITKSTDAYHSPEVWWYLSMIYEKFGDSSYKEALLNCIRYQETMPIREFRYCNF